MLKNKICFAVFLYLCVLLVSAQTGKIVGNVKDYKGKSLPLVIVLILVDDEIKNGTTTDDQGDYVIDGLEMGFYTIKIPPFCYSGDIEQEAVLECIFLEEGQTLRVDLKLDSIGIVEPGCTMKFSRDSHNSSCGTNEDKRVLYGDYLSLSSISYLNDYFYGNRRGNVRWMLEGTRLSYRPTVPISGNRNIHIITRGIPAEYGDFTEDIYNLEAGDEWWIDRPQRRN